MLLLLLLLYNKTQGLSKTDSYLSSKRNIQQEFEQDVL